MIDMPGRMSERPQESRLRIELRDAERVFEQSLARSVFLLESTSCEA